MAGRPPIYLSETERPVSISLRIPRELHEQVQQQVHLRRMTLTEAILEGLRLWLETPADPRDLLSSDNSNTVMQHIQELVNAAVQAALATGYGPPTHPPARAAAGKPSNDIHPASDDIQHYDNTVLQENATSEEPGDLGPVPGGVRAPIGQYKLTPRQVRSLRAKRARGTPIRALMEEFSISKATVFRYLATESDAG